MSTAAVLGAVEELRLNALQPDAEGRVSFPVHPASPLATMAREARRVVKVEVAQGVLVERLPDGTVNNCAAKLGEPEAECQVCEGRCPDRERLALARQVVGVSTERHRERLHLDWERRALHGGEPEPEPTVRDPHALGGEPIDSGQLGQAEDRSSAPLDFDHGFDRERTPGELVGRWLDEQLGYVRSEEDRAVADHVTVYERGDWVSLGLVGEGSGDPELDEYDRRFGTLAELLSEQVPEPRLILRLPGGSLKDIASLATPDELDARDEEARRGEEERRRSDDQVRLYAEALRPTLEGSASEFEADSGALIHVFEWDAGAPADRVPTSAARGDHPVEARCGAVTRAEAGSIKWVAGDPGYPSFCPGCRAAVEGDRERGEADRTRLGLRAAAALIAPSQLCSVDETVRVGPTPAGRSRRRPRR